MVTVNVDIDQSEVFSMVQTFTTQLDEAETFALKEIERVIRFQVFDTLVRALAARAGPGWSDVYTDHLIAVLKTTTPIYSSTTGGTTQIGFDLDNLGDYSDLEKGAHHRAIIDTGEWTRHPPLVQLPYSGEDILTKERRQEFWEEVVIGRNMGFELATKKGNIPMTAGDLGYIATYDEVAFARATEAWGFKAPEWLWLENGFNESEPRIYPVDFTRSLESVTICIASRIYEGAITTLVHLAEGTGQAIGVGSGGRVFARSSGRFVPFRNVLDESVPDYSGCLGGI